ncbi:uncharacterized protein LOC143844303 isoform X1 [Paroedura picta]|uniref:uncharacterized protein LOC143844303 isoform X1 n=1 Tax=Paroedura picta TaxID=143630 RepID=UPI004055E332
MEDLPSSPHWTTPPWWLATRACGGRAAPSSRVRELHFRGGKEGGRRAERHPGTPRSKTSALPTSNEHLPRGMTRWWLSSGSRRTSSAKSCLWDAAWLERRGGRRAQADAGFKVAPAFSCRGPELKRPRRMGQRKPKTRPWKRSDGSFSVWPLSREGRSRRRAGRALPQPMAAATAAALCFASCLQGPAAIASLFPQLAGMVALRKHRPRARGPPEPSLPAGTRP